MILKNKSQL